jgi:hypothetical protein
LKTKSMIIFILLIAIGMVAISGCTANTGVNEQLYKIEDVTAAVQTQNLELLSYGITGFPLKLNGVVPAFYSVKASQAAENVDPDFVQFYIFATEKARLKGVKAFNKEIGDAKMELFPFKYEKGNVLVIYWSRTKESPTWDAIEKGLQQL